VVDVPGLVKASSNKLRQIVARQSAS